MPSIAYLMAQRRLQIATDEKVAVSTSLEGSSASQRPLRVTEVCSDAARAGYEASGSTQSQLLLGPGGRRLILSEAPEAPTHSFVRQSKEGAKVRVDVFIKGDEKTYPKDYVEAHVIGRLPSGAVFESTRSKGKPPMRMQLAKEAVLPGMELGLSNLSLGSRAVISIPSILGYGKMGVPGLIPPHSDLIFEVELLEVDGVKAQGHVPQAPAHSLPIVTSEHYQLPWWITRVERPPPSEYYLNFCRHRKRGKLGDIAGAKTMARKSKKDLQGWDLSNGDAFVFRGTQEDDLVVQGWDLDWIRQELGSERALVKWQGPLFSKKEVLLETPVWETSVAEYIDYIDALDIVDSDCDEANADHCPRLYLNGWPVFLQFPRLRRCVQFPIVDDIAAQVVGEKKMMAETIYQLLAGKSAIKTDENEIHRSIEDGNWELVKLFISPAGAVTRLHYDNGGAHGWLSQVCGRKLFICFKPEDTEHLHAFCGDEGSLSASFLDPLAPDVHERWPNFKKATPIVALLEQGDTIFIPQGWWHYAVSLDSSITLMRNFYSSSNKHEYLDRQEPQLAQTTANALKSGRLKGKKTEQEIEEKARQMVAQIRVAVEQQTEAAK